MLDFDADGVLDYLLPTCFLAGLVNSFSVAFLAGDTDLLAALLLPFLGDTLLKVLSYSYF